MPLLDQGEKQNVAISSNVPDVSSPINFQAMIKLAACTASRKTKVQEARGAHGRRPHMPTVGDGYAPLESWTLVFLQLALAANRTMANRGKQQATSEELHERLRRW